LLVDVNPLIERRDHWQQDASNHLTSQFHPIPESSTGMTDFFAVVLIA
jgi:hypothetical protein